YQNESSLSVSPRGTVLSLDVDAILRMHVEGVVLGAAEDITLKFSGLDKVGLDLGTSLTYSVYLRPGTYSVYATGMTGPVPYAYMESIEVSLFSAEYDIQLERAYRLSGYISIDGSVPDEPVTVFVDSDAGVQVMNTSLRSGYYSLVLPEDDYSVTFLLEGVEHNDEGSVYVEYWSDATVTIDSGDVAHDAALSTRLDNATVEGTVVDERGDPITATVELLPNGDYGMYATFETSSSGAFSADVQPGEYTVYVTRSVDMRVSVSSLDLARNSDATLAIQLSLGQYLQGRLTVAGEPSTEAVTASSAGTVLTAIPSEDGYFQFLLPSGNHTVASSAVRTEGGLSVSYSLTKTVAIADSSVYVDFTLIRDTRRYVEATWDDSRAATLSPGQTTSYLIKIENTGNVADTFKVTYTGTDFDAVFEPSEVWVDFGTGDSTAYVVADLTVTDTAKAGNTTASVTVASKTLSSTRATVRLLVNVLPVRSVSVESLNTSAATSSNMTMTKFLLNNTGNIEDDFMVVVSSTDALNVSGWSARIVDPATGDAVTNVTLEAFSSKELAVEFTATRATPDPKVEATVLAYSSIEGSVSGYGAVPVMVADVVIGPGDLDVVRDDVTYEYDVARLYTNIGLVVAIVALVAMFFILRKRKGLGGGGKK
ncbi:MAG: carboxypeptidase regulatory-like domain-containing protein, partial [Thermoplasmata archaeon]